MLFQEVVLPRRQKLFQMLYGPESVQRLQVFMYSVRRGVLPDAVVRPVEQFHAP